MLKVTFAAVVGVVAAAMLLASGWSVGAATASGTCVTKVGQGTAFTAEGAKSQAYEAILQATDWGMWVSWMASSQKLGEAPGYSVNKVNSKCNEGASLGATCMVRATLCKKG